MAYEKHTWETGEVITAEKLNHMEDGVGEVFIVNAELAGNSSDGYTVDSLDKTYDKIVNAFENGHVCICRLLYPLDYEGAKRNYDVLYMTLYNGMGNVCVFNYTNVLSKGSSQITINQMKLTLFASGQKTLENSNYNIALA